MAIYRPKPAAPSVGIKELKDRASAIVEAVQRTRKSVLITKNNRDVARIVPIQERASSANLREVLSELGLLASSPRLVLKDVELEEIELDASTARKAIRADREED